MGNKNDKETIKAEGKITEETVQKVHQEELFKLEELKKGINDYIKEYASIKEVSYGGVIEVLKDVTKNLEDIMLQNVMKQVAVIVYNQMSEAKK